MRVVSRGGGLGGALCLLALGLPLEAQADYDAGWLLYSACSPNRVLDTVNSPISGSGTISTAVDNPGSGKPCGSPFLPMTDANITFSYDSSQNSIGGTAASTVAASAALNLAASWAVQLQPPAGGGTGTQVTVGAGSTYSLEIAGIQPGTPLQGEAAYASFTIFVLDANDHTLISTTKALPQNQNGMQSGLLQTTNDVTVACCTIHLSVFGLLDVANGASASVTDPPSLTLPAGWTYTLTPEPVPLSLYLMNAVPEPSTALLLSAGIVGLAAYRRRARGFSLE